MAQAKKAPAKSGVAKSSKAQAKPTPSAKAQKAAQSKKTAPVVKKPVATHSATSKTKAKVAEAPVKTATVVKAPAGAVKTAAKVEASAKTNEKKIVANKSHVAPAHAAPVAKPANSTAKPVAPAAAVLAAAAQSPAASQPARAVAAAVSKPIEQKVSAPVPPAPVAQPAVAGAKPITPKQVAERVAAAQQAQAAAAQKKPVNSRHGFKKDEFIVYPAHGVGRIVGIEEQEIAGMSLELFVISFEKDKMTLRVPTGKLASVGMRKLAEEDVVRKAMETLKGRARIKRTMWSRRAQEYEAKINSGDLVSIAEVVRDLYRSEQQPEQSYSERQLYEAALDRMAREIAAVDKIDERTAVQRITEVLSKSAKGRRLAADAADAADADADVDSDAEAEEVKAA